MPGLSSTTEPIEQTLHDAVVRHGFKHLCVGYSGGVDSTALLIALQRLQSHLPVQVAAIHVNHGLQDHASQWSDECTAVCAALGIPLTTVTVAVNRRGNVEANAREARFAAFRTHLHTDGCLLLAHHLEDQVETALLRLFQGRGLLHMRPFEVLNGLPVARPLLAHTKASLIEYVRGHGVTHVTDFSNHDVSFDRNFLRHRIIPELSARWPSLASRVVRVVDHHQATQAALDWMLHQVPDQFPVASIPPTPAAARAWLRAYLAQRDHHQLSDKALAEFLRQLTEGQRARIAFEGGELQAEDGLVNYVAVEN